MMKTSTTPVDPVVIRVWNGDDSDVFAIFPTIPASENGLYCTAYQHVGQHCAADYHGCIRESRPATAAEAASLLAELTRLGYRPQVINRATQAMHRACIAAARARSAA